MTLFSRRKVVPEGAGAPAQAPGSSPTVAELRPTRRRTVGQLLRETREGFGSDIPRVAAALRIRAAYLEAIEEGRYDRLPGPVYALGFVRAYAAHLGLDGDEAVRRFKLEAEGLEAQRDLAFPVPLTERSVPTLAWLLLGLILAICVLGFHYYLSSSTEPRPERVSAVPAELAPPPPTAPAPAASAPAAPAASAAAPVAAPESSAVVPPAGALPPSTPTAATPPSASTSPPAAAPAPTGIVAEPLPPPAATPAPASEPAASVPAAETPAPPPTQTAAIPDLPANLPAGHEYGLANGDTRVVIRALGSAWIRVSDKDGKPVFTQTLLAGDTYHVPNEPGLTFKTGVAKNLAFFVDGRQTPRIPGFAHSNVSLDPERLIAGTAGE